MKVLVIGGGGREHALVATLLRSPRVTELVCAPGNGGSAKVARCVPVDVSDLKAMVALAKELRPDLTVVGPEGPLALGLVDELAARGLLAFGPTKAAAMLETSKGFTKEFLERNHIPTANYAICTTVEQAAKAVELFHAPIVVKADGLAAGKGVLICDSRQTAVEAAADLLNGKTLGEPAWQVVIEEFLEGEEISFLCLADGVSVVPMLPARDHKRIGEGDTGPNTGGMGVYTSPDLLDPHMQEWILEHIARPTIAGMASEGSPFRGVLYCGLMMTPRGPKVLEYNARFGDPETQAILPRLQSDLYDLLVACATGSLGGTEISWRPGASVCVVASAGGYPGAFHRGDVIDGLENVAKVEDVQIFHAGTDLKDGRIVTSGGRVLGVSAVGSTLDLALASVYDAIGKISFDGMYFRRDIAKTSKSTKPA